MNTPTVDATTAAKADGPNKASAALTNVIAVTGGSLGDRMMKDANPLSQSALAMMGWGSLTAGQTYLLNRLLKTPTALALPLTAASFATGMLIPKVVNYIGSLVNRENHDPKDTQDAIRLYLTESRRLGKDSTDAFEKKSALGIGRLASSILKPTYKGSKHLGKAILRGLARTPKNASVGEKVWGLATKGGLIGGSYYLGTRLGKPTYGSKRNYTTSLRNNILAQRMSLDELSEADRTAVLELGMK